MVSHLTIVIAVAALLASRDGAQAAAGQASVLTAADDEASVDTVALGLEVLWALAFARDGHLYLSVTNRDGRGFVRPSDDRVFRIVRRR